ncbi:MAG TPA: helix-turn-helix transcriptional regulator [Verrucomicrobiae bacterium]|nr:helix-turn-helix transcriptional regulator [Verrucomicrobiae bacterium]
MGRKAKSRRNAYGAWLLYLREQKGLSQMEVAELTGVARATLRRWERTGRVPAREEIVRLSKLYGVTLDKFLRTEKIRQG